MKDSGVEWLGQVPEHWGVSALGYYSMLNTGATPDRSKNQYWGGTIPWIKTGEVRYDTIYETEETITQAALSETSVRLSKPGTLLMAMYGQGITRGRVAILGVSATYNQACVAITPNSKLTNDFLKFFFMAGYDALRDGGNETSQMNLNADIVSKFKVLVPSYEEQIDIVSFLRIKLAHYEQLINKSEHAIALMQERRTALISAAVTGKIDLRGWEPPAEEAAA
jgi:type I restriction enzyme S subunit